MNQLEHLKKLIAPTHEKQKVEVVSYDATNEIATLQNVKGEQFTIPSGTVSAGDQYYIKDGQLIAKAKALTLSTIEI